MLWWLGAVSGDTILALYTFKARLAAAGMDARAAYAVAATWELAHLILIVLVLPAALLLAAGRNLRRKRIAQWDGRSFALAWGLVPTVWYFGWLAEQALSSTVLRLYEPPIVTVFYGICALVTLGVVACSGVWLTHRFTARR